MPEYKEYLDTKPTFDNDQKFALNLFKYLMNYEPFRDFLYPQNLLWEDDFDQIAQYNFMMLKALDDTTDEATPIPLMHDIRFEKDNDAFEFSRNLLLASMRHFADVEKMIRDHLNGWEYDRVALMDILMLNMAVAELTSSSSNFVPLAALRKRVAACSTPRSSTPMSQTLPISPTPMLPTSIPATITNHSKAL